MRSGATDVLPPENSMVFEVPVLSWSFTVAVRTGGLRRWAQRKLMVCQAALAALLQLLGRVIGSPRSAARSSASSSSDGGTATTMHWAWARQ